MERTLWTKGLMNLDEGENDVMNLDDLCCAVVEPPYRQQWPFDEKLLSLARTHAHSQTDRQPGQTDRKTESGWGCAHDESSTEGSGAFTCCPKFLALPEVIYI